MCTKSEAFNIAGNNNIDGRCVVYFRPSKSWNGEFGFDWLRISDGRIEDKEATKNGTYEKTAYGKIVSNETTNKYTGLLCIRHNIPYFVDDYGVSHPGPFFEESLGEYQKFLKLYTKKNIIPTYKKNAGKEYYVPKISLPSMNNSNVVIDGYKIRIIIFAIGRIKSIRVKCSSDGVLLKKVTGMKYLPEIVIEKHEWRKCSSGNLFDYELLLKRTTNENNEESLSIYSYATDDNNIESFAGQVDIINYRQLQINVSFITLNELFDGRACSHPRIDYSTQKKALKRFLSQANIVPLINDNYHFDACDKLYPSIINESQAIDYGKYITESYNNSPISSQSSLYKVFFSSRKAIKNNDLRIFGFQYKPIPKCVIIFAFPNPQNKSITSPELMPNIPDITITHELLHCMGLKHSFDEGNEFIFKPGTTSNIMDYDRGMTNDITYDNRLRNISLWKWQWDSIRTKIIRD